MSALRSEEISELASEAQGLLRRLSRARAGRQAILIRLSRLPRENRQPATYRDIAACFVTYVRNGEGEVYRLPSGDSLIILIRPAAVALKISVQRLHKVLRLDPNLPEGRGEPGSVMELLDVDGDYETFLQVVEPLTHDAPPPAPLPEAAPAPAGLVAGPGEKPAILKATEQPESADVPRTPPQRKTNASLALLHKLGEHVRMTDMERFIRRTHIFPVVGNANMPPLMVMDETDIDALGRVLAPTQNISWDPWLNGHLQGLADQPMLRALQDRAAPAGLLQIIKLGLDAAESEAMAMLLTRHARRGGSPIIIAIRCLEAIQSPRLFIRARDALRAKGCKIGLCGVDPLTAALLDIPALGTDFLLLDYAASVADALRHTGFSTLSQRLSTMEKGGLILTGCTDAAALDFGRGLGLSLMGGPVLESGAPSA